MSQMTVRSLMKTPAIVAHPRTTLQQAQQEMTQANVHHLPIVDIDGALVGMVSDRDVERVLGLMAAVEGRRAALTVSDICREEALRVGPDLPAHEAAAMLIESRSDGLPVVDGKGIVIGVLTATDLIEVAREALLGVDPVRRARA